MDFLESSWRLLAGALVLFLPGFAWLGLFWDSDQDPASRLAEAAGISLSLTALFGLATYLIPVRVSASWFAGLYLLMFFAAAWTVWRRLSMRGRQSTGDLPGAESAGVVSSSSPERSSWEALTVGKNLWLVSTFFVFLAVLGLRFYQIRDLALPAWVDSVHHVLIVRLLLERGGLPDTLEPYLSVPFYYHFGFHAIAAAYTALARLEPYLGVLQIGQMLNALVVLSVYRLGKSLWGDWRRSLMSALMVGFVTQMPAYYVSWGRYTLLTGMVLLPLAMAAGLEVSRGGPSLPRFASLCLLTAGVFLAHYYAALLFAVFMVLLVGATFLEEVRKGKALRGGNWYSLAAAVLLGLGLAATWTFRAWSFAGSAVEVGILPPSSETVDEFYFPNYLSYLWRLLGPLRNQVISLAALPGLAILVWRRGTRVIGAWSAFLVISALPWGVYLAPFRPDHAVIVLFLPVALMASDLLISILDWRVRPPADRLKATAVVVLLGSLIGLGIWQTRSIINQSTVLATDADLQALEWIEKNTPASARFFIAVNHWQYGIYRGSDGGWWITPITGRETILPPALYPLGETRYVEQVSRRAAAASQIELCSSEFWQMVRSEGLTHVYVTGELDSDQQLSMRICGGVSLVFSNERVSIYEIQN